MEWILAALLGGFLTFNAVVTPDAAAKRATSALQKRFPGAKVDVQIEGKRGKNVLAGKFKSLTLSLDGVTFDSLPFSSEPVGDSIGETQRLQVKVANAKWEGFPVEKMSFDFQNLRYDWGALKDKSELRLASSGPATMKVRLAGGALLPLVQERVQGAQDVKLQLRGGNFIVSGKRDILGVEAPFELRATPNWSGGRLGLDAPALKVSGVAVPAPVAKPFLGDLSNFYTFDKEGKWPLRVEIKAVRAEEDALEIDADLSVKTAR